MHLFHHTIPKSLLSHSKFYCYYSLAFLLLIHAPHLDFRVRNIISLLLLLLQ